MMLANNQYRPRVRVLDTAGPIEDGGPGGGPIPEPGTLILLGSAMVITFAKLRKKLARS